MENIKQIIDKTIDNAIKLSSCTICQDDIYIDDKYFLFCCKQYYHEQCLSTYIWINTYPKCPICHKLIKNDIKKDFDYIFEKNYKLDYIRNKIKNTKYFTHDPQTLHELPRRPSRINYASFLPEEEIPLLELPRPLRSSINQTLYELFEEPGDRIDNNFWQYYLARR